MKSIFRNKLAVACVAAAASLGFGARAHAETITADLVSEHPLFQGAVLSLSSSSVSQNGDVIGQLNWVGSSSNSQPFNSTFNTYCLDLIDGIGIGNTYTFDVDPALSTAPRAAAGGPMGTEAALELQSLYANRFTALSTDDDRIAFQLSIWSVVYNQFGQNMVDNAGLNFHVVSGVDTTALSEADNWLAAAYNAALTNTGKFDTNVVALEAVAAPGTGDFAQDQIFVEDLPGNGVPNVGVPEINSSAAGSLAVLLLGTLAVIESRRSRRKA